MSPITPPPTEPWACSLCQRQAPSTDRAESDLPCGWVPLVLACGLLVACGRCLSEHGASIGATRRALDSAHDAAGGCAGCRGALVSH